jgi:hypothetical protein
MWHFYPYTWRHTYKQTFKKCQKHIFHGFIWLYNSWHYFLSQICIVYCTCVPATVRHLNEVHSNPFRIRKIRGSYLASEKVILTRIYGEVLGDKSTMYTWPYTESDRLCGLVIRVSGYRYRGLGFDPGRYQIFWVVVCLERGPLSLMRSTEELLE